LLNGSHRQLDTGRPLMLFVRQDARHSPDRGKARSVEANVIAGFDERFPADRVVVRDGVARMQADDGPVVADGDLRFTIATVA